jgi:predicted SnoaL-like aldol condensation-catalyzing enzyme
MTPEEQITALLKSIETDEPGPVAVINPDQYVQHNLGAADGLAGFRALLAAVPAGSARVQTVRAFQDGPYVFAHTEYDFFGPKIGFDIFRVEHGRIGEHWDNLQTTAGPNPSGHTMIDGPTAVRAPDRTDARKALVRAFVDDILVNGRLDRLTSYFDGDRYVQHNPQIADGLSGLGAALEAMAAHGITMKYDTVHTVLGEGEFVLDDTIETVPPRTAWKNQNGKFGF